MNERELLQLPVDTQHTPLCSNKSSNLLQNNQEQLQENSAKSLVIEDTELVHSPHPMVNVSSSPVIRDSKLRGVGNNNRVVRNLITSNYVKPTACSSVSIHPTDLDLRKNSQKGVPYEENMLKYVQFHKAAILASNNS